MTGYRPSPARAPRVPIENAVRLRREMSPPEAVLWPHLRASRLGGFKFRRQHPLGPFVADFYCHAALLVVEIDGEQHADRVTQDRARDAWMREQGLHVLRIGAQDIARNCDGALKTIREVAEMRIRERGVRKEGR